MTKNEAARIVRANADAVIAQCERWANGWDRGAYRDDDTLRLVTIKRDIRAAVRESFELSARFGGSR